MILLWPDGVRRLSWKETAEGFHLSWDQLFDAVEHVSLAARSVHVYLKFSGDESSL
jgi:hypothetical protein